MVSIQQSSKITMNKFRVKINLLLYFVVNFMIIMVILVFFMVISVNRRLFRYFGSYSGISVIPVISVNRRTGAKVLNKLPVPGRLTNLDYSRARAYCACSRCGWGLFGHFFSQLSLLVSFSLSLGDGPI